jgi:hypothetical protein
MSSPLRCILKSMKNDKKHKNIAEKANNCIQNLFITLKRKEKKRIIITSLCLYRKSDEKNKAFFLFCLYFPIFSAFILNNFIL